MRAFPRVPRADYAPADSVTRTLRTRRLPDYARSTLVALHFVTDTHARSGYLPRAVCLLGPLPTTVPLRWTRVYVCARYARLPFGCLFALRIGWLCAHARYARYIAVTGLDPRLYGCTPDGRLRALVPRTRLHARLFYVAVCALPVLVCLVGFTPDYLPTRTFYAVRGFWFRLFTQLPLDCGLPATVTFRFYRCGLLRCCYVWLHGYAHLHDLRYVARVTHIARLPVIPRCWFVGWCLIYAVSTFPARLRTFAFPGLDEPTRFTRSRSWLHTLATLRFHGYTRAFGLRWFTHWMLRYTRYAHTRTLVDFARLRLFTRCVAVARGYVTLVYVICDARFTQLLPGWRGTQFTHARMPTRSPRLHLPTRPTHAFARCARTGLTFQFGSGLVYPFTAATHAAYTLFHCARTHTPGLPVTPLDTYTADCCARLRLHGIALRFAVVLYRFPLPDWLPRSTHAIGFPRRLRICYAFSCYVPSWLRCCVCYTFATDVRLDAPVGAPTPFTT